ncbi:unnamed protein product [Closterium sp. Naga37s-1]|nr:unnamed protein product [Closterium sp. Naga37s-1]
MSPESIPVQLTTRSGKSHASCATVSSSVYRRAEPSGRTRSMAEAEAEAAWRKGSDQVAAHGEGERWRKAQSGEGEVEASGECSAVAELIAAAIPRWLRQVTSAKRPSWHRLSRLQVVPPYFSPRLLHASFSSRVLPVLARLRGFLPQMEQENQKLQRAIEVQRGAERCKGANGGKDGRIEAWMVEQGQQAVSMEAVDDSQQHIEMDLSLGLVDLRTADAVAAAERALSGAGQGSSVGRGDGEGGEEGEAGSSDSDSELEPESEDSDGDDGGNQGGIRRADAHGGDGLGGGDRCVAMEEDGEAGSEDGRGGGGVLPGGSLDGAVAGGDCGVFHNTLAFRLLALDCGADMVYSEEVIDHRFVQCKRVVNSTLNSVDFVEPTTGIVVFRTCEAERTRVAFQIGTADAVRALRAAEVVCNDVAAIDINMGCPKPFSTSGGMGAALLSRPENACDILTTLRRNLPASIAVTCKIRLLDSPHRTIDFARAVESTGISALGIHARKVPHRPSMKAQWEALPAVVSSLSLPVIANGDVFCYSDFDSIRAATGASSAMAARAALWNPTVFRPEGQQNWEVVKRLFLRQIRKG